MHMFHFIETCTCMGACTENGNAMSTTMKTCFNAQPKGEKNDQLFTTLSALNTEKESNDTIIGTSQLHTICC